MSFLRSLITTLIISSFIFTGCGSNENKNLAEEVNIKKEQELLQWENQLKSKDQKLTIREQRLDSLNQKTDTVGRYNAELIGEWSARMLCTETSCAGSAIGDTKTEQWNITYDNNRFIVKASSNKVVTRIYTGFYKENNLKLTANQSGDNETIITINLREVSEKKMEGIREINQVGTCKIIYSLEIEKV